MSSELEMLDDGGEGLDLVLSYKGARYRVPTLPSSQLADLISFVGDVIPEVVNARLIARGKQLSLESTVAEAKLKPDSVLIMVGQTADEAAEVASQKPDPLVKPFSAIERDEAARIRRTKLASKETGKQDPEFRFESIKAEFQYHTPTPYEAERLMRRLAGDPGIVAIMRKHQFKVWVLTEMSPAEAKAKMAARGQGNMDLLGENTNFGQTITLKLRTEDVQGFRKYHDLIDTLIHELVHNVHGPHDDKFWALYRQLKQEYLAVRGSPGRRLGYKQAVLDLENYSDDEQDEGVVLGGAAAADPRAAALRAAEARSAADRDSLVCVCGQVHGGPVQPVACVVCDDVKRPRVDEPSPRTDPAEAAAKAEAEATAKAEAEAEAEAAAKAAAKAEAEAAAKAAAAAEAKAAAEAAAKAEAEARAATAAEVLAALPEDAFGVADEATAHVHAVASACGAVEGSPDQRAATMGLVRKLVANILLNPQDTKYRSVKLANGAITGRIVNVRGGLQLASVVGFESVDSELRLRRYDAGKLALARDVLDQQLVAAV